MSNNKADSMMDQVGVTSNSQGEKEKAVSLSSEMDVEQKLPINSEILNNSSPPSQSNNKNTNTLNNNTDDFEASSNNDMNAEKEGTSSGDKTLKPSFQLEMQDDNNFGDIQFFHHKLMLQHRIDNEQYASLQSYYTASNDESGTALEDGLDIDFGENPFVFPENVMEYGDGVQFFPGNCVGYLETILEETDEDVGEDDESSGRHWWTADSDTDTDSVIRVDNNRLHQNQVLPNSPAANPESIAGAQNKQFDLNKSAFRSSASSRPFEQEDLNLLDQLDLAFEETLMEPRRRSGIAMFDRQSFIGDKKQAVPSGKVETSVEVHDDAESTKSESATDPPIIPPEDKTEAAEGGFDNSSVKVKLPAAPSPVFSDSEEPHEVAEEDFLYSSPGSSEFDEETEEETSSGDDDDGTCGNKNLNSGVNVLAEFSLSQPGSFFDSSPANGGSGGLFRNARFRRSLESASTTSKLKSFRSFDSLNALSETDYMFAKSNNVFPSFPNIQEDSVDSSNTSDASSFPQFGQNANQLGNNATDNGESANNDHKPPSSTSSVWSREAKPLESSLSTESCSSNNTSVAGTVSSENLSVDSGIGGGGDRNNHGFMKSSSTTYSSVYEEEDPTNDESLEDDSLLSPKSEFALNPLVFSSLSSTSEPESNTTSISSLHSSNKQTSFKNSPDLASDEEQRNDDDGISENQEQFEEEAVQPKPDNKQALNNTPDFTNDNNNPPSAVLDNVNANGENNIIIPLARLESEDGALRDSKPNSSSSQAISSQEKDVIVGMDLEKRISVEKMQTSESKSQSEERPSSESNPSCNLISSASNINNITTVPDSLSVAPSSAFFDGDVVQESDLDLVDDDDDDPIHSIKLQSTSEAQLIKDVGVENDDDGSFITPNNVVGRGTFVNKDQVMNSPSSSSNSNPPTTTQGNEHSMQSTSHKTNSATTFETENAPKSKSSSKPIRDDDATTSGASNIIKTVISGSNGESGPVSALSALGVVKQNESQTSENGMQQKIVDVMDNMEEWNSTSLGVHKANEAFFTNTFALASPSHPSSSSSNVLNAPSPSPFHPHGQNADAGVGSSTTNNVRRTNDDTDNHSIEATYADHERNAMLASKNEDSNNMKLHNENNHYNNLTRTMDDEDRSSIRIKRAESTPREVKSHNHDDEYAHWTSNGNVNSVTSHATALVVDGINNVERVNSDNLLIVDDDVTPQLDDEAEQSYAHDQHHLALPSSNTCDSGRSDTIGDVPSYSHNHNTKSECGNTKEFVVGQAHSIAPLLPLETSSGGCNIWGEGGLVLLTSKAITTTSSTDPNIHIGVAHVKKTCQRQQSPRSPPPPPPPALLSSGSSSSSRKPNVSHQLHHHQEDRRGVESEKNDDVGSEVNRLAPESQYETHSLSFISPTSSSSASAPPKVKADEVILRKSNFGFFGSPSNNHYKSSIPPHYNYNYNNPNDDSGVVSFSVVQEKADPKNASSSSSTKLFMLEEDPAFSPHHHQQHNIHPVFSSSTSSSPYSHPNTTFHIDSKSEGNDNSSGGSKEAHGYNKCPTGVSSALSLDKINSNKSHSGERHKRPGNSNSNSSLLESLYSASTLLSIAPILPSESKCLLSPDEINQAGCSNQSIFSHYTTSSNNTPGGGGDHQQLPSVNNVSGVVPGPQKPNVHNVHAVKQTKIHPRESCGSGSENIISMQSVDTMNMDMDRVHEDSNAQSGMPIKTTRVYGPRNEVEVVFVRQANSRTPSPAPPPPSSSSSRLTLQQRSLASGGCRPEDDEELEDDQERIPIRTRVHFSPVVSEISWRESYHGSEVSMDEEDSQGAHERDGDPASASSSRPLQMSEDKCNQDSSMGAFTGEMDYEDELEKTLQSDIDVLTVLEAVERFPVDDNFDESDFHDFDSSPYKESIHFSSHAKADGPASQVAPSDTANGHNHYEIVEISSVNGQSTTLSMVPDLLSQCEKIPNSQTLIDVCIEDVDPQQLQYNSTSSAKPPLKPKPQRKFFSTNAPPHTDAITLPSSIPPVEDHLQQQQQIFPKIFEETPTESNSQKSKKSNGQASNKGSKQKSSSKDRKSPLKEQDPTAGSNKENKEKSKSSKPGFFERLSKIRLSGSKSKKKVHPKEDEVDHSKDVNQDMSQGLSKSAEFSFHSPPAKPATTRQPILKKSTYSSAPTMLNYRPSQDFDEEPEEIPPSHHAFDNILEEIAGIRGIKQRMDKSHETASLERNQIPAPGGEVRSFAKRQQQYRGIPCSIPSPPPTSLHNGKSLSELPKSEVETSLQSNSDAAVTSVSTPDLKANAGINSPYKPIPAPQQEEEEDKEMESRRTMAEAGQKHEREWYKLLKTAAEKYYYRGSPGGHKDKNKAEKSEKFTMPLSPTGIVETDLDTGTSREMLDEELVIRDMNFFANSTAGFSTFAPTGPTTTIASSSSNGNTVKTRSLTNLSSTRLPLSLAPFQFDDSGQYDQGEINEFDERAKSYEFLLDDNQKSFSVPPENRLAAETRNLSEHELRVQRSLQRLNVPEWYKKHENATRSGYPGPHEKNLNKKLEYGSSGGLAGGWSGLSTLKTPSMSSLTGGRYSGSLNRSNFIRGRPVTMSATRLSRESLVGSSNPSPSAFDRCSFTYGMPFSSTRYAHGRLNSGQVTPTSVTDSTTSTTATQSYVKPPYLGWRSQERLTALAEASGKSGAPKLSVYLPPAERAAIDVLRNKIPISDRPPRPPRAEKSPANDVTNLNSIPPPQHVRDSEQTPTTTGSKVKQGSVHDSIREVTQAISQFITRESPKPPKRKKQPGRKAVWIESSFVGKKPGNEY